MKRFCFIFAIVSLLFATTSLFASTYYISPTGDDSSGTGSSVLPWATLSKGMTSIKGGDTLICKDGTYTGYVNSIYFGGTGNQFPPFGTSSNYTIVKAEHDGEAIFDGQDKNAMFDYVDVSSPTDNVYWQFEGLLWCNTPGPNVNLIHASYVKFLRCGAYDCGDGNTNNFYIRHDDYVLLEGCYSYGTGRYKFEPYQSNHIILRNCVARHDRHSFPGSPDVIANYSMYSVSDGEVQNCIAIDSDQSSYYINASEYAGCFAVPSTDMSANRVNFTRCIGLNCAVGGINSAKDSHEIVFQDCVVWDGKTVDGNGFYTIRGPNTSVLNCTFGNNISNGLRFFNSSDPDSGENNSVVKDNIIYNQTGTSILMYDVEGQDYNCLNGNSNATGVTGTHNTSVNPLWNASTNLTGALKYITRIETGSNLKGQGESGADIGANITTLIGTPGTLWGEAGYNTDTGVSMWPFPNEDLIRSKMKAYDEGGVSGDRGFCAEGTTLTRYIWEYLGNTIPSSIYGPTPAVITDLSVSNTGTNSVTLAWTAPGSDENTGTATSYDIRYSLVSIDESTWDAANQVSGEPIPQVAGTTQSMVITGLQSETTYYFAMQTTNSIPHTSGNSNTVSAKTGDGTAPAEVTDLTAVPGTIDGRIVVSWTAPGDDNENGIASSYDLRYSLNSISDANWTDATQYLSEPVPKIAGSSEVVTLSGLTPGTTYYFALKTSDDSFNTSALSNISSCQAYKSGEVDITAPAGITDVSADSGAHSGEVVLNWTATGDDGSAGTALMYDIRYSQALINAYTWSSATQCSSEPEPQVAGSAERFVVTGLTPGQQYYFAVQAIDNSNFGSGVFNVPQAVAYNPIGDTTPPGQVTTLAGTNTAGGEATITWTAPGGDGSAGTALDYEIRYASFALNASNFTQGTLLDVALAPNSAGFTESAKIYDLDIGQTYYIAIKSTDGADNESALSNVATVTIGADSIAPGAIADLTATAGTNIGEVVIGWTASGNDGSIGKAKEYDIRYSTVTITDGGWQMAVRVLNAPSTAVSGTYQSLTIANLTANQRYYFGIKSSDTGSNVSALSNIVAAKAKGGIPPGKINDLSGQVGSANGSVFLSWTAPASADASKVKEYEIRYSTDHIYEVNLWRIFSESEVEWSGAGKYPTSPSPVNPGEPQSFVVSNLAPGQQYYFAIKSYDSDNNASVISNVTETFAANSDAIAPGKIEDLQAEPGNIDGQVMLHWTAPGNNGTTGTAASYIVKYSLGYIDASTWNLANALDYAPTPKEAGLKELMTINNLAVQQHYYFALKAIDSVGNVSELSNCAETLSGPVMNLERVRSFPNPWKKASGGLITISHLTPTAKIKIFNLAGELVRELEEQSGVAFWDAKNEDGQDAASGVYIYYAWDEEGHEKTGKMAIVK